MFVLPPPSAPLVALARTLRAGADLGSISIPRLRERASLYEGTSGRVLARGAGHYRGTGLPSTRPGTVAIAAHRVTPVPPRPAGPFRYIDRLRKDDTIIVRFRGRSYVYSVYGKRVVRPSAVWVLARATRFQKLVLTTCTPPHSSAFRLVVFAKLRSER